jgi:hypothetical protein
MAAVNSNPFEMDEVEPPGTGRVEPPGGNGNLGHARMGSLGPDGAGMVQGNKGKFIRAQTGLR